MSNSAPVNATSEALPWITCIVESSQRGGNFSVMYRQVSCWNHIASREMTPDFAPYAKQGVLWIAGVHGPDSNEYKALVAAYCLSRGL